MALLSEGLIDLIRDRSATKVIATIDENGVPYAVASPFLQLDEHGLLVHLELLEKSYTNRNLLRNLWYDRKVAISVGNYVIRGVPIKVHISGPLFRQYYEQVRSVLGDADFSTVWLIEPDEVVDETYSTRKRLEEEEFPFSVHLDRLTF